MLHRQVLLLKCYFMLKYHYVIDIELIYLVKKKISFNGNQAIEHVCDHFVLLIYFFKLRVHNIFCP